LFYLNNRIHSNRLIWICHVERMERELIPKQLMDYTPWGTRGIHWTPEVTLGGSVRRTGLIERPQNLMIYKNSVRTTQETQYVSATKTDWLMLFWETMSVYCDNHMKHTDALCVLKRVVHIIIIISGGGTKSTRHCGHSWPIVQAADDRWGWLWSNWWNEDWQWKPKYSEETCPSATLSTTNSTWPDPGSNPGRRGGKPATNRLTYGAAWVVHIVTTGF
jgi:hypothetical protein